MQQHLSLHSFILAKWLLQHNLLMMTPLPSSAQNLGTPFKLLVQKMKIVRCDGERNVILVKGSIPGAKNALVAMSKAEQI